MSLTHLEVEIKVEAGRQDLGHLGSRSNSSRKEKGYHEEETKWSRTILKKKEAARENQGALEAKSQGRTREPLKKTAMRARALLQHGHSADEV